MKETTYNPRPTSGGQTLEKQNNTTHPAPSATDDSKWFLQSKTFVSRTQLIVANKLIWWFTSALTFATSVATSGSVSWICALIAMKAKSKVDLDNVKDEISYAEMSILVDGYNSSLMFTEYFNENGQTVGMNYYIITN